MTTLRAARILAACSALFCLGLVGCAPGEPPHLATLRAGLELNVPGDYATIQAAMDAATYGDVVQVAAGDYYESVAFRSSEVTLAGAGPGQTILHGQVRMRSKDGVRVTGLTITNSGAVGLTSTIGIEADGEDFEIDGNLVTNWSSGIGVEGAPIGMIRGNLVRQCELGIELMESSDIVLDNNLVLNNAKAGIILFSYTSATMRHNTVVGNGFAADFDEGGAGIAIGPFNNETVQNNLIVSNHGGINALQDYSSRNHHNLVWGNVANYVGDATVGAGDVSLDPEFVDAPAKDYRLLAGSPAIDAGLDLGVTSDYAGNPRPDGTAPDLGALEHQAVQPAGELIVSEVMANPIVEGAGEFVELYNPTAADIDAAGLVLSDGDALDWVYPYAGGATLVPPGGYAVILDPDYATLADPYDIPAGAVLLTVDDTALGSGLSTSDPISLIRAGVVVSTFANPFNPGDGVSAERIDLAAADDPSNWVASPCGASPGRENCISSGGGAQAATLVISEVMANPVNWTRDEFVEVYNYGADPVELAGLVLSDGDSTDVLIAAAGRESLLPAGAYGLILDPDHAQPWDGPPYYLTQAEVPVIVTVAGAALGDGLAKGDPVTLLAPDGVTVIATYSHPVPTSGQSVERIDLEEADLPDNWSPCTCPALHSAGRPNCAGGGGGPVDLPDLVINEVMANPLDEDRGEFIELHNRGAQPVDVAGLVFSDGDASDTIESFPGHGVSIIPAGGYGIILDPEYGHDLPLPAEAVWLAPGNSTLGNGLATNDPITLYANDGVTVISTYSHPINPGNGISVERIGDTGDVASNWIASPCASGSSPGGPNCASDGGGPEPVSGDLVIAEVMANPDDEARGEFVEIVNTGETAVDLAGYWLSDGDAADTIEGYQGGSTSVPAGGIAVVLDQGYAEIAVAYDIPPAAVLLTVDDASLGSGLAVDDPISLLGPDGATLVSTYGSPFNPGNAVSVERIDLAAADTPDNWVASPCPSGSSPGRVNCADQAPVGSVVDVNQASAAELEQVTGIGPATAGAIVAYRDADGPFESLLQLTVIDGITQAKIDDWMVAEPDESEYVIGLADAHEVMVFADLDALLAALPDPASPGFWNGQRVRIQRAACASQSDAEDLQDLTFADWGDEALFEPNGATLPVFLDRDPAAGSYLRAQTDHANAMADWVKEDGDPFNLPMFYRWASPLASYGTIAYGHVYALEGVLEVDQGAWRLRIRARADAGVDRVVLIERWLDAADWGELQVVWTYNYKPAVVEALSGYSYSLPYRLTLAHPCRQWWFDQVGEWLDVFRCPSFDQCSGGAQDWAAFNAALAGWRQDPGPVGDYCFTYDYTDYCFSAEEEVLGVDILNNATYEQLTDHCYSSSLANTVLANRPYASIDAYDATYGVGPKSLWNLLVCYVRSGDWPEAAEGTVAKVLQDIPDNEWHIVTVEQAEVTSVNGALFDICDPGTDTCIAVYSYAALPAGLQVGAGVRVVGQVKYYDYGGYWELTVDGADTWVTLQAGEDPRTPVAGDLVINEFLADPDLVQGDANCDGVRSASDDEFVELVNVSAAPLILDGVGLSDALQIRHVFAPGTTLEPGQPIVVFGGGGLACPAFAQVQAVAASTGALSLNNAGDTIGLTDALAAPLAATPYGGEAGDGQSLTLSPDLNDLDPDPVGVSGFAPHMQADEAGDSSRFSPGRRVDGSAF